MRCGAVGAVRVYNCLSSLFWLGHVARVGNERLPKRAFFGWWQAHLAKMRPPMRLQQWLQYRVAQVQATELDWCRLAQGRQEWRGGVWAQVFRHGALDAHGLLSLSSRALCSFARRSSYLMCSLGCLCGLLGSSGPFCRGGLRISCHCWLSFVYRRAFRPFLSRADDCVPHHSLEFR